MIPFYNKLVSTPLQVVNLPWLSNNGVELLLKRDDLIDGTISGNKWRKLYGYVKEYERGNYSRIVTWGSGWSNHIHACSELARLGIPVTAIVPEDVHLDRIPSLTEAGNAGVLIDVVSRKEYRNRNVIIRERTEQDPSTLFIPEGGSGPLANEGIQLMIKECKEQEVLPDMWLCAAGVGGQMLSMMDALDPSEKVVGVECVKGAKVMKYISDQYDVQSMANYDVWIGHQGGLGKWANDMPTFLEEWNRHTAILLDPLYTSKMMYSLKERVLNGEIKNTQVLAIHSGGMIAWKNKKYKDGLSYT